MQQIEPSALHRNLSEYLAGHHYDGLFTASLDHSPTEQLIGEEWHTSALIVSAGVEHSALAHELGRIANPKTGALGKWKKQNPSYRKRFSANLMSALSHHRVMVFAISARETSVLASEDHFVKELGATGCYQRQIVGGRARVFIGPFVNARTGENQTIELPENQAPMVLFLAHFLRRIHQEMHSAFSVSSPTFVTWNILADMPPAGAEGPFGRALAMLLGLHSQGGSLRWGHFLEGDKVETDLLADNTAGLLNEIMRMPQRYSEKFGEDAREGAGLFYWERWTN